VETLFSPVGDTSTPTINENSTTNVEEEEEEENQQSKEEETFV